MFRGKNMGMDDVLFGETDDSCALCGLRGMSLLSIHHIDSNHSNNNYDNQIVICHNCHHRYNQNKGITLEGVKNRKRHLIAKTLTQYGVNALKIAERNDFGVIAMPFLLHHLVGLGYMTEEETQMGYSGGEGKYINATVRFAITDKGKELLKRWQL